MTAFLRTNPAISILLGGLAIVVVVFGALAVLGTRAGVSFHPWRSTALRR